MHPTTISPWTKFFYSAHVFSCLCAIGYILSAYYTKNAEESTIGHFNLYITWGVALAFYIVAGMVVVASLIGYLAQRLNKPSLWIMFCILMSFVSLVEFAASISSFWKVANDRNTKQLLRSGMDEYVKENSSVARRWDKLHSEYKCCGVDSYQEWQDVQYGRTTLKTPLSCCLPENQGMYCSLNMLPEHDEADKYIYTRGCFDPVIEKVNNHLTVMGVFGVTVSLVHFSFVSLSCFLVITKKI